MFAKRREGLRSSKAQGTRASESWCLHTNTGLNGLTGSYYKLRSRIALVRRRNDTFYDSAPTMSAGVDVGCSSAQRGGR